jgi:transcriptional regulator with XRE-family HTH domain
LTQEQVAERIKKTVRTLIRWENPQFDPGELSAVMLDTFAELYGVTVGQLRGIEPLPDRQPTPAAAV